MKQLDITGDQTEEIKELARFLNRENELVFCDVFDFKSAKCIRKKSTDRQYSIINTDVGLMVIMDYEDLNYNPGPICGRFYYCQLENSKIGELNTVYLVIFDNITINSYFVKYQPLDVTLTRGLQQPVKAEWKKSEITVTSFDRADVDGFFRI